MKSILILLLLTIQSVFVFAQIDFYSKRWSRVYKYELKSLPKSALNVVDSIYTKAKQDKNIQQITKALLYHSKFALTLQEDAELLITKRFEKEIGSATSPLKNILESVLAEVYWEYFKINRNKYYERTPIKGKPLGDDFRLWDWEVMFRSIDFHYQNSLQNPLVLKKINLVTINDLLAQAENSKLYRPTLYDFLAHNALDFYETGESLISKPISHFEIKDPTYFENFEFAKDENSDSLSAEIQALKLYRELLTFHKTDKDPSSFVSNELDRLQFLVEKGNFENEKELHKSALKKLKSLYSSFPVSTLIDYELASIYNEEGNKFQSENIPEYQFQKHAALELCQQAISKFPSSDGSELCKILRDDILRPNIELTAERFVPSGKASRLLVGYKNIDSLTIGIYRISEKEEEFYKTGNDSLKLVKLAAIAPVLKWTAQLKNLNDHHEHNTELIVPPIAKGRYLFLVRILGKQQNSAKTFAYATVQVTDLVLVESAFSDYNRYQVVDRNTGNPIYGADVHLQSKYVNGQRDTINQHSTTDKQGFFKLKRKHEYLSNIKATVAYKNDTANFGNYWISSSSSDRANNKEELTAKPFLFTDRSIYRPGQTVFFKGILIKTKGKKSSVVSNQYVLVILEDANYQNIDSARVKTNSFGSFSGEFKLPSSGLTGEYTLSVEEDDEDEIKFYDNLDEFYENNLTISVEEYKRPTFEVLFDKVKETFKLGDSIKVQGNAVAFSGAKITGAKVKYSIKRNVRYPSWYYWGRRNSYSNEQELAEGTTVTNQDGLFFVKFKSVPDEKVSKNELPVFEFEISAEVTDINGETRTAKSVVKVGYHSLTANISAPASFNRNIADNSIRVTTENLNSQSVKAKGTIQILKLDFPAEPQRERPWNAPDLQQIAQVEFSKLFPHDPYVENSSTQDLRTGKLVTSIPFDTEASNEFKFKIDKAWDLGEYLMLLGTEDGNGNQITAKHRFEIFDPTSKRVADNKVLIVEADKPSYKAGEVAKVKVGSASKDISVVIDIEKQNEIIKTYVKHLSSEYTVLQIPIEDNENGFLTIHYSGVNYNSFFKGDNRILITKEKSDLEIETISFKDKLQPGAKETWSFEVKASDSERKEAEVLASMYDASLDQFKSHSWYFNPIERTYYYSDSRTSAYPSFGTDYFRVVNQDRTYYYPGHLYFDQFDMFGFTITNDERIKQGYLDRLYSKGYDSISRSKVIQSNNRKLKKGFVYGKIVGGDDGSPLPGVNVVIKGTTIGTVTDADGNYMIQANKNDVIVFSFIGLSTAEAQVGRKNVMNVQMNADVTQLSEVVVTALGVSTEKRSLSYSVAMVMSREGTGEVVFGEPVADSVRFLHGKIAGVQITGVPGGAAKLMIRGASSINDPDPLYVVDGVIVESSQIDKDDLESVQVLKDDAATALYGAKGQNGVLIITTKSGQKKLDEELAKVNARKNFNETAFFFPQLSTDENGRVKFTFTTPESLTRWKLQLLAHTRDLLTTTKILNAVTQKDMMVTPNAPRFLRTGDEILFSTKITNLTGNESTGNAMLQLTNAVTGEQVDLIFENSKRTQPFKVSAKGSTQVSWKLKIPVGVDAVQYKVVAKAGDFSDGEQNVLPILSNRVLVTETMPMSVRTGETKTFSLEKLRTISSSTIQHHQLTLEVTSNPAWYAIQALPYLMEFPHECSEQTFARYYANSLASYVANSNPNIKKVFDQWANSNSLISNLEKNQELKSTIIQETPWLRDAQTESEQKKRIGLLFDMGKMKDQLQSSLDKLEQLQLSDGGFTWFVGGRYSNPYITQHIASGFGHLRALKVVKDKDPFTPVVTKAVDYLDAEFLKSYNSLVLQAEEIKAKSKNAQEGLRAAKEFMDADHVNPIQIHYLYMRSFYPDIKISENVMSAMEYYRNQTARYWKNNTLSLKGMIALIHYRNKSNQVSHDILQSLKENGITSEELGMYWKENKSGWYWNEAPIETQALLIEAFSEIESYSTSKDRLKIVDDLRIWLLKNKQTNQWQTTKATTEAIYAMLLNGTDWLSVDDKVDVLAGGKKITPSQQSEKEAGTGYYKTTWKGNQIKPELGTIKMIKKGEGSAWAGLYWQYFEDMDKITSAESPLKLGKKVFRVTHSGKGEVLTEVKSGSSIEVGSLLRIRIELKADRDMEFLHMKDLRAAGLEPVDVLSEYKWQEGLGYYQSTKDASTNFFFDSVSKGVYVFEYDLRVNNKGNFANGITTIQCMYAPEFSSHSEGIRIKVD